LQPRSAAAKRRPSPLEALAAAASGKGLNVSARCLLPLPTALLPPAPLLPPALPLLLLLLLPLLLPTLLPVLMLLLLLLLLTVLPLPTPLLPALRSLPDSPFGALDLGKKGTSGATISRCNNSPPC
jgi:hypothetical protein